MVADSINGRCFSLCKFILFRTDSLLRWLYGMVHDFHYDFAAISHRSRHSHDRRC